MKIYKILEKSQKPNEKNKKRLLNKKFFISKNNKTKVALTIFDTEKGTVDFPQYIKDAIKK